MKIDGNAPNANVRSLVRPADEARLKSGGTADRTGGPEGDDAVHLSSQVEFVDRAVQAAASSPVVRHDKVEAARQKVEAGAVGQDPLRLANRLTDYLLEG